MQQPSSPLPIENSLNFTYDLFKDLVDSQYTQADALDSKANNIVVAASALLVAGLVLQHVFLSLFIRFLSWCNMLLLYKKSGHEMKRKEVDAIEYALP